MLDTPKPRVLMAPMNLAMMPVLLVEELQRRGYHAHHLQLNYGQEHPFGFRMDREFDLREHGGRIDGAAQALTEVLQEDFNLFHFWNKSLFYKTDYGQLSGFDIPMIKARGLRLVHRFSGFDLRLPTQDMELNEHSPFHHGYTYPYSEALVQGYHGMLREYVDAFVVQDPEMAQFMPDAHVVPRGLDLDNWQFVGPGNNPRPLVVHAPSNAVVKGTPHVMRAVEDLRREGLDFDFQLIQGMQQDEAREIYKRADIIVDQLLIGATGVLTLEGWALGKCVILNLRPDLFNDFYETTDLPCVQATPDTITDSLRTAIGDAALREDIGVRARQLVERFHPIEVVADRLLEVYDTALSGAPKTPTGTGDVEYLRLHATRTAAAEGHAARARKEKRQARKSSQSGPRAPEDMGALERFWTSTPKELTKKPRSQVRARWNRVALNHQRSAKFARVVLDHTIAEPIDLVIAHDVFPLTLTSQLRDRDGSAVVADMIEVPVLGERSGAAFRNIPEPVRRHLDATANAELKRADVVTTVSPSLVDWISDHTGRDVSLLRNFRHAIATPETSAMRSKLRLSATDRIIAMINTAAPGYGVDETIHALAHLDDSYHLVHIGRYSSEQYRRDTNQLVHDLGLAGRFHVVDKLEPLSFVRYLAGADVGVITANLGDDAPLNLRFAFPNRVTDYISARVPVVACGMHDVDAFVTSSGVGKVIDTLEPQGFAAAIAELAEAPPESELRLGIERAATDFSWEREADPVLRVCDRLARDRMLDRGGQRPTTLIAARKMISGNGRIWRTAKSLSEAGHQVTVAAYDEFASEFQGLVDVKSLAVRGEVLGWS